MRRGGGVGISDVQNASLTLDPGRTGQRPLEICPVLSRRRIYHFTLSSTLSAGRHLNQDDSSAWTGFRQFFIRTHQLNPPKRPGD
ncbi:hypothetical protein MJO29_002757 [Puccinia striiformis f. sp. tritici]|nr:hypothetical protein MJO29_002757 [Puccinia striiformis f. sp. tritici]